METQGSFSAVLSSASDVVDVTLSNTAFSNGASHIRYGGGIGDSSFISLNANDTKNILMPLGHDPTVKAKIIAEVSGTVEFDITHPTLSNQKIIIKEGTLTCSMKLSAVSVTEKAGSSATIRWSIVQITSDNSGEFS